MITFSDHFSSEIILFKIIKTWIILFICNSDLSFIIRMWLTSWKNLLYNLLNKLLYCISCCTHVWIKLRMNIWMSIIMWNQRCFLSDLDMLIKIITWLINILKLSSLVLLYILEMCCKLMIMYVFLLSSSTEKNFSVLRKYFLEKSVICAQRREN